MIFGRKQSKFKSIVMLYKMFRRWKYTKKLQAEIVPSQGSNLRRSVEALEEYLDLCEAEANIAPFMKEHDLSRQDLKRIYNALKDTSLGKWKDEHYLALTTIAYLEPLAYFVVSEKKGSPFADIVSVLQEYWNGEIARGSLIERVEEEGD